MRFVRVFAPDESFLCVCVCVFGKFEEIRIRLVDSLKSVTIFFYACFDFFRFILSIFNDSVIGIGFLNK